MGHVPLVLALIRNAAACVRLLVVRTRQLPSFGRVLELIAKSEMVTNTEIANTFLDGLAARRRKLRWLALRHVEQPDRAKLGLSAVTLPDTRLPNILAVLNKLKIIPVEDNSFYMASVDIYQCCELRECDTGILQRLWDTGFRDVGCRLTRGLFPLELVFRRRCPRSSILMSKYLSRSI